MDTYDIKRELKALYAPRNREWDLVTVPRQRFLALDGAGDPNTSAEYAAAIGALYGLAYTLKFEFKRRGRNFVVGPLEALWWADGHSVFLARDKDAWQWTAMISLPEFVSGDDVAEARVVAAQKKGDPLIEAVSVLDLDEGPCAQVLHVGSYDDETPTLVELHERWLPEQGLRESGKHHEVYHSDPRRVAPEKLKTVIRQPVTPA